MQTLRLRVNNKILSDLLELLSKFKKNEIEVITEDERYVSVQKYLENELNEMNEGKASYTSIEALDNKIDRAIRKHENKD